MIKKYNKETNLQNDILMLLEAYGYPAYNIIQASKSGVSDILACVEGRFVAIEVKLEYNQPSALQERKQQKIRTAKGFAIVAKHLEDVTQLIETIKSL